MSKFLRFITRIANLKKKRDFPSVVNYEITSRCNLKCEHCYWHKTLKSTKELSDAEWKKVFLEHRKKGATHAHLTGGEPGLRPNVIRLARDIFKGIGIVSNGTIKIPNDIQTRIFVSIDGPATIHNKIRGVKIFDKVMKNIKDDKRIILTPTLTTTNYKYIDTLVEIARESGVEGITFSTYTSHSKGKDSLLLQGKQLDEAMNSLLRVWKKNKDIVYLTPKIIKILKTKAHYKTCFFLGNDFVSYDATINIKKPCVIGEGVNCSTCGCIVPIVAHALKLADVRAWFMFDRLFPEKYYKI